MTYARRLKRLAGDALSRVGYELRKQSAPADEDPELYAEYDEATLRRRPFINVGAGRFAHRHWTNVDYATDWYEQRLAEGFVSYDITSLAPLPFQDGTIKLAYTSHTIEHVPREAAANLFREAHRVLEPGGGLRVTCPDAGLMYRAVVAGREGYWRWQDGWFCSHLSRVRPGDEITPLDRLIREVATPRCRHYIHAQSAISPEEARSWMEELDYAAFLDRLTQDLTFNPAQPGDHITWWDEERVMDQLRLAGFETVYVSRRNQSLFSPMTNPSLFDSTRPTNSLYVEAVR